MESCELYGGLRTWELGRSGKEKKAVLKVTEINEVEDAGMESCELCGRLVSQGTRHHLIPASRYSNKVNKKLSRRGQQEGQPLQAMPQANPRPPHGEGDGARVQLHREAQGPPRGGQVRGVDQGQARRVPVKIEYVR